MEDLKDKAKFEIDLFKVVVIFWIIYTSIRIWQVDHPTESKYDFAQWSSLVLALPPHTKDWKEFQGKTYCLIDSEWHQCEPNIVNENGGQ